MKRLVYIEFQKIWKNRSGRVLSIAYFVLLALIALLSSVNFKFIGLDVRLADVGIFNFPYIWHFNTYVAALLKLFLAVVIISMMANEYSYGTLKQNLIDGFSKKEFVGSKFLMAGIFALISTIFVWILSLVLGFIFSSYNEFSIILTDMDYILAYFVKLAAFFSFCLFLGILVKRSAFALGFIFLWNIVEWLLIYMSGKIAGTSVSDWLSRLLPLEAMSTLILNPARRTSVIKNIEKEIGAAENLTDYSVSYLQVGIVVLWICIFVILSYKILKKRDL